MRFTIALLLGMTTFAARTSADVLVYSNDFSGSAGSEWSNNTIATSNGERFLGTSASGFGNGAVSLTLSGLQAHDMVTVSFDLYIIQSWDGNGPAGGGPDNWGLAQNGVGVFLSSFANYSGGGNTQSYSPGTPNGLVYNNPARSGQFDAGYLGFGTGDFGDATYRLSFTFASSASNLILDFTSYQNQAPGDEGWGLDNVTVSINPAAVPEPSALASMALGAMGLAAWAAARRRCV